MGIWRESNLFLFEVDDDDEARILFNNNLLVGQAVFAVKIIGHHFCKVYYGERNGKVFIKDQLINNNKVLSTYGY